MSGVIYTLGHSTRSAEEFLHLLAVYSIQALVDVRRFPRSRRHPHFNDDALGPALHRQDIDYVHIEGLGGRRAPAADSQNAGWQNDSFRGYADYMQTADFTQHLETLLALARQKTTAILCAEAVPWRCHRSLIADALLVRGWQVLDIFDEKNSRPHALTSFAQVEGERITYPPSQPALFSDEEG